MTAAFLFIILVQAIVPCALQSSPYVHPRKSNASDEQALLAFKSAIEYDQFNSFATWTPNVSFCNWKGISCSHRRQRVVSLNLSTVGLNMEVSGHVTTKGDVYSYGIMLLEMMTRKKPTSSIFVEGMNLHKWVSRCFPNAIEEVVESYLLSASQSNDENKVLNCLRQLICVGLLCTKESPEERPSMNDTVKVLHIIKDSFLGAVPTTTFQLDLSSLLSSRNVGGNDDESRSSSF